MSDYHLDHTKDYGTRKRCNTCNEWWPCGANELHDAQVAVQSLREALADLLTALHRPMGPTRQQIIEEHAQAVLADTKVYGLPEPPTPLQDAPESAEETSRFKAGDTVSITTEGRKHLYAYAVEEGDMVRVVEEQIARSGGYLIEKKNGQRLWCRPEWVRK